MHTSSLPNNLYETLWTTLPRHKWTAMNLEPWCILTLTLKPSLNMMLIFTWWNISVHFMTNQSFASSSCKTHQTTHLRTLSKADLQKQNTGYFSCICLQINRAPEVLSPSIKPNCISCRLIWLLICCSIIFSITFRTWSINFKPLS